LVQIRLRKERRSFSIVANLMTKKRLNKTAHQVLKFVSANLLILMTFGCATPLIAPKPIINSSEDFLGFLKYGQISLQKGSIVDNSSELDRVNLIKKIKITSPDFQEFMLDYYYYKTDTQVYVVMYNWYSKHCEIRKKPLTNVPDSQLLNVPGEEAKTIDDQLCFIARHRAIEDKILTQ
jgi:hypothetical protein